MRSGAAGRRRAESQEGVPEEAATQSRVAAAGGCSSGGRSGQGRSGAWRAAGCLRPEGESEAGPRSVPGPPTGHVRGGGGAGPGAGGAGEEDGEGRKAHTASAPPPPARQPGPRGVPSRPPVALRSPSPAPPARPGWPGFRLTSLCLEFAAASPGAQANFTASGLGAVRSMVNRPSPTERGPKGRPKRGPAEALCFRWGVWVRWEWAGWGAPL